MAQFNSYFSRKFIENKGALLNASFSDRSDGKTFDCKKTALDEYIANKWIRIYIRRYSTEFTQLMYEKFMSEICQKPQFDYLTKNYEFQGEKGGIKIRVKGDKKWDWLFYFVPLSKASKLKSAIDISRVYRIDYDEFIPMDKRYLKDEITLLLDFWKSIDRDRFTTKIFMFGNKIDMFNPLFDYFDIDLSLEDNTIRTYKNGTLAIQVYSSNEHREVRENSKFNDLIKGTKYECYDLGAVLNKINIKTDNIENAKYYASFMTERGEGSIWLKNGNMIISEKKRKDGILFVDKPYNIDREQYVVNYGFFPNLFRYYYRRNSIAIDTSKAWYIFEKIIQKAGAS